MSLELTDLLEVGTDRVDRLIRFRSLVEMSIYSFTTTAARDRDNMSLFS